MSQLTSTSAISTEFAIMDGYIFETNMTNATTDEPLHERDSPEGITEAATLIVIMIASFFANILAMTQILTSKKLRKIHHNLLIVNLNVIDLGITVFSMTFSVAAIFDDGYLLKKNPIVCTINGFCAITCSVGNFTNVMCIAVDRYISIVWSTRFPASRRRVYFMIAFVWVVSITITLPPTFGFISYFVYTDKTHHCSPSWQDYSYYIIWFTVIFGVTVPVMIISYACIIYHIRQSDRQLRVYDGMKTSANISKQLSGSKGSGSLQSSQNLGSNTCRDSHRCRLPHPAVNAQPAHLGKHNSDGASEASLNRGFQGDGLDLHKIVMDENEAGITDLHKIVIDENEAGITDLHEIVLDENEAGRMAPRLFVISGRRCSLSTTQSLPIFGPSKKESDSKTQDASHSNSQRETCSTHSRSRAVSCPVENGEHARGHKDSDHRVHLDNALNKLSARKLSVDKRVAVTGAMLILTTIFCWAPYCIVHFPNFPEVSHSVAAATMWIAYANSMMDPLVYVFMNRKESTIQHLSSILTTFCEVPRKTWRRLCGKGTDW
eukprot:XP_011661560.1 PREDICTED: tyramine receptor 1 isoform X1 [Strongylocentrotus purpuratus]